MLYCLVACEESQAVTIELRKLEHKAFSCDLQECSGGHPEWHIPGDCLPLLDGFCEFTLQNGNKERISQKWDLIIAHPPCTYLTVSGNRWFNVDKYGEDAKKRLLDKKEAVEFFLKFTRANCDHIAIENPVGCMSKLYREPDCIIQPYYFGDNEVKTTCLWLKGLPNLVRDCYEEPNIEYFEFTTKKGVKKRQSMWYYNCWCLKEKELIQKMRSKTFPGIAHAMAYQWSTFIETGRNPLNKHKRLF